MRNHDDALLRGRRPDPRARMPLLHQVLRIALYDEFAAQAFFRKVVDAFGPKPPFASLLADAPKRIGALAALCAQFGVPRPLDPFPVETAIAPGWRENCERAAAGEAAKVRLYESLARYVREPRVQRVFRRLASESLGRRLPALRRAAADAAELELLHVAQGVPAEQAYIRHGLFADFLERTFAVLGSQHQALGVVGPLLRNTRPAMLAGLVAGGAGVLLAKGRIKHNRKDD